MPGVSRLSIPGLVAECRALHRLGILAMALFPNLDPRLKDGDGTAALREDALVLRAVRAVKKAIPGMIVMTDIALDPYTVHGHDGVLTPELFRQWTNQLQSAATAPAGTALRAGRLGVKAKNLLVLAETNVERIVHQMVLLLHRSRS